MPDPILIAESVTYRVGDTTLVERVDLVAAGAQRVALRSEIRAVPVVAIAANHARRVHFALQERAIDVNLILDLAVVEVQPLVERREAVTVVIVGPIPT